MSNKTKTLQLKRFKQTFCVTITGTNPRYADVKKELHQIITQIGGVMDEFKEDEETDDIPIPVPTYGDDSDDEDEPVAATSKSTNKLVPDLKDIVLGVPRDLSDVYGSGFKDVEDESASVKELQSFAIVAFRLKKEEGYTVIEPVLEED